MNYTTADRRKRVNFMISMKLVEKLNTIPAGERSDFVNEAIQDHLERFQRQKTFDEGTVWQKKLKFKISNEELLKSIQYGRKE